MPAEAELERARIEFRLTEMALRQLTDEIRHPRTASPPSGNIHRCTICGRHDVWGPEWTWFGKIDEEPKLRTCSRDCWEQACRMELTNG